MCPLVIHVGYFLLEQQERSIGEGTKPRRVETLTAYNPRPWPPQSTQTKSYNRQGPRLLLGPFSKHLSKDKLQHVCVGVGGESPLQPPVLTFCFQLPSPPWMGERHAGTQVTVQAQSVAGSQWRQEHKFGACSVGLLTTAITCGPICPSSDDRQGQLNCGLP